MASIDYAGIRTLIVDALRLEIPGVYVEEETYPAFAPELSPWVGVFLERRDAPAELQVMAAGSVLRMELRARILVLAYHLGGMLDASRVRDDILGQVETAVLKHKTLFGGSHLVRVEGGDFVSAQAETGFWAVADTTIVGIVTATV